MESIKKEECAPLDINDEYHSVTLKYSGGGKIYNMFYVVHNNEFEHFFKKIKTTIKKDSMMQKKIRHNEDENQLKYDSWNYYLTLRCNLAYDKMYTNSSDQCRKEIDNLLSRISAILFTNNYENIEEFSHLLKETDSMDFTIRRM
ncbi:uncharacterized protein VNE69_06049 [Vairimorpha necatrix]|uniref:Uncharacterized protein n=1 Tax=Vairimorpha necatrix TaxID=6039 RepID=A0AAX4JCX9_9MICR